MSYSFKMPKGHPYGAGKKHTMMAEVHVGEDGETGTIRSIGGHPMESPELKGSGWAKGGKSVPEGSTANLVPYDGGESNEFKPIMQMGPGGRSLVAQAFDHAMKKGIGDYQTTYDT